ncbi:NADH-quinone oxidoreductase subunit NuoF family protein [Streptomyces calidiresistens]|nr:NADH-ubiquinone oxidoreductase-F iron-sulfur binding region domain-containing protein [Streptomyces calidiresistens]
MTTAPPRPSLPVPGRRAGSSPARSRGRSSGPVLAVMGHARLLAGLDGLSRLDRVAHLAVHGDCPRLRLDEVVALAENISLRGRGGAGFPFARKVASVAEAANRRGLPTAVVVNGSEGEPSCLKDKALLRHAPHLVIDGAVLAAEALGAQEVVLGVTHPEVYSSVRDAIAELPPGRVPVRVQRLAERFVTGESSSMTRGLNGGPTLPSGQKIRTSEVGLHGLPTLFSNTETYAQLAVAARLGALGYREVGTPREPGTVLLSIAGACVMEAPAGAPLIDVLRLVGLDVGQGVLIGGYHGKWLSPATALYAELSRENLERHGATLGAGAILPLPAATCPVGETVRVARWMADESAGQCGPCLFGLPSLADALEAVWRGGGSAALDAVHNRMAAVRGRGACSHPDGTAGFVTSALDAFPGEFADHALGGGCGRSVLGTLPLPPEPGGIPIAEHEGPKLHVDWTLCQGHGLCADILPGVVELGPDGFPASATMAVPREARAMAIRAVRRCPALAMRVTD